jgi:hypothetical protein
MTIRTDVDRLIDWYEHHCHIVGRVLPVLAASSTIGKFARKERRGGPYLYRGCEIIPIGRANSKRGARSMSQTELIP